MSKKITITENNEELVNYVAKVRGIEFDAAANLLLGIGYSRISATMKYDQALKERGVKRTRPSTKKAGTKKASKKAAKKAEGGGTKKAAKKAAKSTKKAKDKKVKRKQPSPVLIDEDEPSSET